MEPLEFPLLAPFSQWWTHLIWCYVSEAGDYKIVGETRDDAVGEAYDKVGRVMERPIQPVLNWQLAHQGQDVQQHPSRAIN